MSGVLLVLWLTFLNSPDPVTDGALTVTPVRNYEVCEQLLADLRRQTKRVDGRCIAAVTR